MLKNKLNFTMNNAQYRIIEEGSLIGEGTNIWNFTHIRNNSSIGTNCNIGNNVYIDSGVIIGNNVKIQNSVNAYNGLKVGNDVFVGPSVTFTNDLYPRAFIWGDDKISKTIVENGVSIGANSTIKCGITIGEFALIGAGTMVTKDIPAYSLVVGNPGRIVGKVDKSGNRI